MPHSTPPADDPASKLPLTPLSFEILLSLADGERHGYGIIKEIEARTGEPLRSSTGTLYLALQRLVKEGLVGECGAEGSRRSRAYSLTELGRSVAAAEADRLAFLVGDARRKKLLSESSLSDALRSPSAD